MKCPKQWPAIFTPLQTAGNVSRHKRPVPLTAVGMVIARPEATKRFAPLNEKGENAWKIGIKALIPNSVAVIE